jgi:WD40 repeat protein
MSDTGNAQLPEEGESGFSEIWSTQVTDSVERHVYVQAVACAVADSRPVVVTIAGPSLTVWDLETGEPLARSEESDSRTGAAPGRAPANRPGFPPPDHLLHLAVTGLGTDPIAVTADAAGRIQAWDVRTGARLGEPLYAIGQRACDLAAGRIGEASLVLFARGPGATSGLWETPVRDAAVEVWDLASRSRVWRLHHGGYTDCLAVGSHGDRPLAVASATFAPNPFLAPSDSTTAVFAWDLESGEPLGDPIQVGDDNWIDRVAVGSANGHAVAVGGSLGHLWIWHPMEGRLLNEIRCPTGRILSINWATFETRPVLVVNGDRWLQLWDLRDWSLIAQTRLGPREGPCVPTPDGRVILPSARRVKVMRCPALSGT